MSELNQIQLEFVQNALYRIDENTRMITISLSELTDEEVWQKPNASLNSIANLILHVCGNMTQYAISSLGELNDNRQRDIEFKTTSGLSKTELLEQLNQTVEKAKQTIKNATTEQLIKQRKVQGFTFSGIGVILHVVEHFSYHTGQIAFWTKQLKNKDLGFYDGMNLTIKNSTK